MSFLLFRNASSILRPACTMNMNTRLVFNARHTLLYPVVSSQATNSQVQRPASTAAAVSTSKSASLHWNSERMLSALLIPLIPASIILDTMPTNYLLAAALVLHSHWGFECIITDYVHGSAFKFAEYGLYLASILAFAGLCYFNYNDVGLSKAIKKLWKL